MKKKVVSVHPPPAASGHFRDHSERRVGTRFSERATSGSRNRPTGEKVFGKHSVRAVILQRPQDVKELLIVSTAKEPQQDIIEIQQLAVNNGIQVQMMPLTAFLTAAKFTEDERRHKNQGICAFVRPRRIYDENDLDQLRNAELVVVLDQVSNPQNLATILRNCAFFHVDGLVMLKDRSAEVTPEVARVAVGGAEFVRIYRITNLARSLDYLKKLGFWVYGLDGAGGQTIGKTHFDRKSAIVLGAEGEGLRQRTRHFCDVLVRIPGGRPGIDSLNVAIASGISLAEITRQRQLEETPTA